MKDIINKNDFSKSKDLCKYLVKINLGPCIDVLPVKTLILIDATKGYLVRKVKNII